MFNKLTSALAVFRVGSEIANAEKWKAGQISGTLVAGFILALVNLAGAFGHPLPLDAATANAIGAGVIAVANVVLSSVTSARAGLLPAKAGQPVGDCAAAGAGRLPGLAAVAAPAGVQHQREPDLGDAAAATGDATTGAAGRRYQHIANDESSQYLA